MYDIIAVGELLIDFTPESAPGAEKVLFSQNPGGAPANVLAQASALGANTALVSRVGQDAFGAFLVEQVARRGVNTDYVSRDDRYPTTLAFVHLDAHGDRSFSFYRECSADRMLNVEHIPKAPIEQAAILHFGGVSMTDLPARSATVHAVHLARESGTLVSYDPNYRPALWESEADARQALRQVLPMVDIIKVSEEELPLITDTDDLEEGSRRLSDLGITLVLISRGAKGAYYRLGALTGACPAYAVDVVDTTGAGDAFMGAVLSHLCHMDRDTLESLTQDALNEIVDFANAAGSLTCTRKGAIAVMPTEAEIAALRRERKELTHD